MNRQDFEALSNDKALQSVAMSILKATAYKETVQDVVKPIQQEIINFYKWEDDEGNIITEEKRMYRAKDEDFNLYLKELNSAYTKAGFKVELNYCPLLIAENMEREIKREFIDMLEPYTGLNWNQLMRNFPTNYNNYIELNLKILVQNENKTASH